MTTETRRVYDLAVALAADGVGEELAVECLERAAAGQEERLLAALIEADRALGSMPAAAGVPERAACLLRLATQRSQRLPRAPESTVVLSPRVTGAWRAHEGDRFGHGLLTDLARLRAVAGNGGRAVATALLARR